MCEPKENLMEEKLLKVIKDEYGEKTEPELLGEWESGRDFAEYCWEQLGYPKNPFIDWEKFCQNLPKLGFVGIIIEINPEDLVTHKVLYGFKIKQR